MKTWSDLEGYFDYADLYDLAVSRAESGDTLVEIGVWNGRSIVYLADRVRESGKTIRVVGVDNFQSPPKFVVENNLHDCGALDIVSLIASDSAAAASQFADGSVAFAFIDADHSYEAVKRDITAWLPKIKRGGIIAGHDAVRAEVDRAVRESFPHFERMGTLAWLVRL